MLRTSFILFLAVTAWINTAQIAHAIEFTFREPTLEQPQFINYEKYHKPVVPDDSNRSISVKTQPQISKTQAYNGWHYSKAEKQISAESLTRYLEANRSPLSGFSNQLLESPYWSTIIGICTIEQYNCTKAPYNNYWGIMLRSGGLRHFSSLPEAITAISDLLAEYDAKGKSTVESLNGYYVQPASQNWFNTVIKTKTYLESLN